MIDLEQIAGFDWDDGNSRKSADKHDVSQAEAESIFFNDPLLNTTLKGDSIDLANTVIHELTHNTFYASGQAPFNESFAMFVGAHGAAAFFRSRSRSGYWIL